MLDRVRTLLVRIALWAALLDAFAALIRWDPTPLVAAALSLCAAGLLAGLWVKISRLTPAGEAQEYLTWILSWLMGVAFLVVSQLIAAGALLGRA